MGRTFYGCVADYTAGMTLQERLKYLMAALRSGRKAAHVLAQRLKVTVRTIYRDIQRLRQAGHRIEGVFGPGGGFLFAESSRPAPVELSTNALRELVMVAFASSGHRHVDTLLQALPLAAAEELRLLLENTQIEARPLPAASPEIFAIAAASLKNRQMVCFHKRQDPLDEPPPDYAYIAAESRKVAALGLIYKSSGWVMKGMDWYQRTPRETPFSEIRELGLGSMRFRGALPTRPCPLFT